MMGAMRADVLRGHLDTLLLAVLADASGHGYELGRRLTERSGGELGVPEGSLYPALHRLEQKGWLQAEWKQSETGREAKFYALTRAGRKQLAVEKDSWERLSGAVRLIFDEGSAS
jgi:transcriptional regulator